MTVRLLGLRVQIPPGHECLSFVNILCYQVEVSDSGLSLVQLSPTKCGVSVVSKPQKQGGLGSLGQLNFEKIKAVVVLNSKSKGINMIRNVTHIL
jgi:GTP cyclohydrolase FolE2